MNWLPAIDVGWSTDKWGERREEGAEWEGKRREREREEYKESWGWEGKRERVGMYELRGRESNEMK